MQNLKKETDKAPLIQFQLFFFATNPLVYRKIFTDRHYPSGHFLWTGTINPGIFRGRALWADSVSPPMNTIASRERFKPTGIGENLVVNYITLDNVPARLFHVIIFGQRRQSKV